MPATQLSCSKAKQALLLIESDAVEYSERAAQLCSSHFYVTRADNPRDVYLMWKAFDFSIALLSDAIGQFALRASAQIVRVQWPKARILILGEAPDLFDDHLYDESVVHASSGNSLLAMVEKISEDTWNQRGDALAARLDHVSVAPRDQQYVIARDSHPIKVSGLKKADYARDWPKNEHLRQAVR